MQTGAIYTFHLCKWSSSLEHQEMSYILRFGYAFLALLVITSCAEAARTSMLKSLTEWESKSAMMESAKHVLSSHMQRQEQVGRRQRYPVPNRISPGGPDPHHH